MILRGSLFSQALEMETGITVIVPASEEEKPSKVVYLLHGLCGASGDWVNYTQLPVWALDCNAFFIMPEVGRSFYADMTFGQRFFTYVAEELPDLCEKRFAVSRAREDTAIMGCSMGGYGALKSALRYPKRFGCCCAFSPACLFMDEALAALRNHGGEEKAAEMFGQQLVTDFRAVYGPNFASDPGNDLLSLAKDLVGKGPFPDFYASCGSEDPLLTENTRFNSEMQRLGIPYIFESSSGEHDWPFFNQALKRGLDFFFKPLAAASAT